MKKPFFARHALLILMIVFFFVPFALRGSRYAVQNMKNDVKDWLPDDFPETAELEWFRERFLGEQFVVISWDGCRGTADDESFQTFVDKLFPELPPSAIRQGQSQPQRSQFMDESLGLYVRSYMPDHPQELEDFIGNRLNIRSTKDYYEGWGGRDEKWLRSGKNQWVYITPNGELYQWTANRTWPAGLWRGIRRATIGPQQVDGEFLASLGPIDGPWYYEDPRRLNARLFKSITTGPSVLSDLTREDRRLNIDRKQAHERLRGVLFGADDLQTCIVVTLTEAGKLDPRALLGRGMLGKARGALLDIAEASGVQVPRAPPVLPVAIASLFPQAPPSKLPMLRLGGPLVDNAAIDEEGQITLARLLGFSLAVGLGLSWLCFRSVNITIMVFLVGGISAIASVGIVHWTGSQLDAVLMSMPSLVYVLGISGAVHIVNYYRESVMDHGIDEAPGRAIKTGYWPCTIAAITTALGLLSLSVSNIIPIRKFGCYAAIGVVATLVLLFTYLPAALETWPPTRFLARSSRKGVRSGLERFLDEFWQTVGSWVIKHYRMVSFGCFLVLLSMGLGLRNIQPSIQLLKLFDRDAKIIRDYEWFEANLGKLVPMEIVIRVDKALQTPPFNEVSEPNDAYDPSQLTFLERMEISDYASREISRIFGEQGKQYMARPMLASTFAPEPPAKNNATVNQWVRSTFSERLERNRDAYVDADFLRSDAGAELWRISLRLAALSDIDFGEFVKQVQGVVEPMLRAYEYRNKILRELGNGKKQRVFLVGYPAEGSENSPSMVETDRPEIDQTRIFSETLERLLRNDRLAVHTCQARQLRTMQDAGMLEADRDCVVILQDDPQSPLDASDTNIALRIDARDHFFDPSKDLTVEQRRKQHDAPPSAGLARAAASDDEPGPLGEPVVSAIYTGLVPIVYKAQRTLLVSLIQSTGWAFAMIAMVMILLLRSPKAGLLAMLPNVFPVVAVFGVMGWSRISVDIGSMMTASVAMGVAVDDTIHFLSWFRRGLDEGCKRNEAILLAYRRVATAMSQTTAIGGIGLSIFAFSTFTPTQRFGALMLALLATALVGDLLFLPALLASPLGRVFDKKRGNETADRPRDATPSGPAPHLGKPRERASSAAALPPNVRRDERH